MDAFNLTKKGAMPGTQLLKLIKGYSGEDNRYADRACPKNHPSPATCASLM